MLLKQGVKSYEVELLQENLKLLSYAPGIIDGIFGKATDFAVRRFQSENRLIVDGIVGDETLSAIKNRVMEIQKKLNNHGANLIVDGMAGTNTYNAVCAFQSSHNIIVDGIVGPYTLKALEGQSDGIQNNIYDISERGINFIADYENFYDKPYRGLDYQNETIGYGHVIRLGEHFDSITKDEAKALLKKDLASFVSIVNGLISGLNLSQNQFDALISFSYNCGVTALQTSTLLKDIKSGTEDETIREDFCMFKFCNKKPSLGLWRRRMDEADIYLNADYTRTYRNW